MSVAADMPFPRAPVDGTLLAAYCACLAIGVAMVASASMGLYENPFHILLRHLVFLLAAFVVLGVVTAIPLAWWSALYLVALAAALGGLALLLVPGVGREVNGATRWIGFGPFSLQVTEFAKFGFLLFTAGYVARYRDQLCAGWRGLLVPLACLAILTLLLHLVRDFGAAVVIGVVTLTLLFIGGARLRWFLGIALVSVAALASVALLESYRLQRLTCFMDPWKAAHDCGYQLTQALIAFGRGEWFGLGLGQSIQKLAYLPEAHNDFLLAVIAEETGLVGVLVLFGILSLIVARMLLIGRRAAQNGDDFAALAVYGAAMVLATQFLISAGVNLGALPTKGLTLPFVSFGGNSLLVCTALLGLALRADWEAGHTGPVPRTRGSHARKRAARIASDSRRYQDRNGGARRGRR